MNFVEITQKNARFINKANQAIIDAISRSAAAGHAVTIDIPQI